MSELAERLDALLNAYRSAGVDPSSNLQPGLPDSEIDAIVSEEGLALPEPVRELYRWRNGNADPYAESSELFWFRDQPFLSLEDAMAARTDVQGFMSAYAAAGVEAPVDAANLIPIAAFEGQFYVVPGGNGLGELPTSHPVITVGESLEVHFLSIASMIETCIDWASDPTLDAEDMTVEDEDAAWDRHNPGVFDIDL